MSLVVTRRKFFSNPKGASGVEIYVHGTWLDDLVALFHQVNHDQQCNHHSIQ